MDKQELETRFKFWVAQLRLNNQWDIALEFTIDINLI